MIAAGCGSAPTQLAEALVEIDETEALTAEHCRDLGPVVGTSSRWCAGTEACRESAGEAARLQAAQLGATHLVVVEALDVTRTEAANIRARAYSCD